MRRVRDIQPPSSPGDELDWRERLGFVRSFFFLFVIFSQKKQAAKKKK